MLSSIDGEVVKKRLHGTYRFEFPNIVSVLSNEPNQERIDYINKHLKGRIHNLADPWDVVATGYGKNIKCWGGV